MDREFIPVEDRQKNPRGPPLWCEYTAPGAPTEGMDCRKIAEYRHVDSNGITKGLYCKKHSEAMTYE